MPNISIEKTLDSLRQALTVALGENLVSVIQYAADKPRVNVLVVVRSLEQADWGQLSSAFDKLKGRATVESLLLSEDSLKTSTDVFPILIREIKSEYSVVHGEDVIAGLKVHRSHLRLRCEQELKNLQLRMQSICLMHFASPHRLRMALIRDCQTFVPLLEVAYELTEQRLASADELLRTAARKFELDEESLSFALQFATEGGEVDEDTISKSYIELMTAVRMTAAFVDQLPEA